MLQLLDHVNSRPSGLLVVDVFRRGRKVDEIILLEHFEGPNLVVDGSKQAHARLIGGDVANRSITQFGVGTNGAAPAPGNTALTGAFIKPIDAVSYPATNSVQFAFSLATTEANGMAILEFGLFTAGSVLYARKVRSAALNKDADLTLSGTWTITF